jgi:hypothetical protein
VISKSAHRTLCDSALHGIEHPRVRSGNTVTTARGKKLLTLYLLSLERETHLRNCGGQHSTLVASSNADTASTHHEYEKTAGNAHEPHPEV